MPLPCAAPSPRAICTAISTALRTAIAETPAFDDASSRSRSVCPASSSMTTYSWFSPEAGVENRDDVGVRQRGDGLRFALEPCAPPGIVGERRRQHFDRDVAAKARILRPIHFAHAAGADGRRRFHRGRGECLGGGSPPVDHRSECGADRSNAERKGQALCIICLSGVSASDLSPHVAEHRRPLAGNADVCRVGGYGGRAGPMRGSREV